ncbi:HMA domain-containing protein [Psidium guajava]|nr:HMA domain-containing protein [Psidium guajava]
MQKAVLRVGWGNERERKRAMKMISGYQGIQSVAVDLDNKKVTVIGDMDPVYLAENLRKRFDTAIEYVGPKETPTRPEARTEQANPDTNVNIPTNPYPENVAPPYHPHPYPPYHNPAYPFPSYPYYPFY